MDDVVTGIVLHTDRALRQLSVEQQFEAVEAPRVRAIERTRKTDARRKYETLGCKGKLQHPTEADAEVARVRHGDAPRLMAYHCDNCGFWHLGHRRRT